MLAFSLFPRLTTDMMSLGWADAAVIHRACYTCTEDYKHVEIIIYNIDAAIIKPVLMLRLW